ncbi:spherulation-specific family 4 protein [Streptomyces buecherae]|uniref:spherulation-specific family 4 protein n=1 Tax=Streptomyces buecherae TaxID=2763006 RepID=UPI00164E3959|nr:spherulation-specific family 4 protein [Streptomyces buecherae]MBC3984851.1 phage tail protein [Streptomyces buecherae]MBC3992764.1 phage tail protein [Streptomyces buecherae]QNJ40244.1 phage tail protein [Streptomyces buecherae]
MPYVTSTGTRRTGAVAGRLGFGVPGCAHPLVAPAEWAELARPYTPLHWAVLNVARGPGARPDPHCLAAAARLHEARGRVLGHLDVRFGTRPFGELLSDAHRFLEWYQVDGFYLDRCPTERPGLAEVRRIATTLRALRAPAYLVFAHGTHPHPSYVESADQLVTFSGQWADYRWSQAAAWTADYPPERFCHLVHGVPRTHLDEALRIARWQGAGTIYFTDRQGHGQADAWETLPGYWDEIVSRIGPGVTE